MKKILFAVLMLAVALSAAAQKPARLKVAIEPNSALSAINPSYASFQIGDKVKVNDVESWHNRPAWKYPLL